MTVIPSVVSAAPVVPVPTNAGCDPLDPMRCLLPFPNDFFTLSDSSTDTGRRVNFNIAAMPRNGAEITGGGEGKPIDPTELNRNDGFSPGSMVMTYVPGIDLHQTWGTADRPHSSVGINEPGYFDHRDHIADIGMYLRADAPMVIINTETGERHPFWSELDTHPGATEAGEQVLILRPARNFEEGTRYVVGLRRLRDASGAIIPAQAHFRMYRDALHTNDAAIESRRPKMESIFKTLEDAGIVRRHLYLAWDFTVASERNLSERILTIRDDAFGRILGDANLADRIVTGAAPTFTVDDTEDRSHSKTHADGTTTVLQIRRIHGRIEVPNYMDRIQQTEGKFQGNQLPFDFPAPGSRLYDDPADADTLPDQNPVDPTVMVPYMCDVVKNGGPRIPMLYGHGLLGERGQLGDLNKSPMHNGDFMGCALDWWGMSLPDLPTVASILPDASQFPSLADRAQQGFLNFMYAGRALIHPQGFASHPDFQDASGRLVRTADADGNGGILHYDGNSQGGIMGGSLVAVSPDIHRGILGVTGMNYSTLLNRSVDWEGSFDEMLADPQGAVETLADQEVPFRYAAPFYASYSDPIERQLVFSIMQMLWDRGETNGYAHHLTDDPLDNTPAHEVMLQVAWSDHQVANTSAETEARTIAAPLMEGLPAGRHWEMNPYFTGSQAYPYRGSALIYWDSGNATPPNGNLPPSHGGDPHSHPRDEAAASWQEAQFLLTGWMVDVCGGGDYLTRRHPANGGSTPSCHPPVWAPGSQDF
jgi:hypothetical protein